MLPCARSCIGEKLKSLPAACASSPRTEPLLFLYPRWFRETARSLCHVEPRVYRYSTCPKPRSREVHSTGGRDQSRLITEVKYQDAPHPADDVPYSQLRSRKRRDARSEPTLHSSTCSRANRHHKYNINVLALVGELTRHPPTASSDFNKAILLDASFLHWLTGTSGENIWRHHDGSSCLVHVKSSLDSSDGEREVILSGSKRAMEIAHQNLKDSEARYLKHNMLRGSVDNTNKSKRLDFDVHLRVDQIPRPDTWSLRSFSEYIRKVVTARKPRVIERELYPGSQSYNLTAAKVLVDMFDDPHMYQFQSSYALRQALEFCSTRTEIAKSAAIIWSTVKKAGILPDIACYNFEIRRNLAVKNGAGVRRLLREMRTSQTTPDSATWACLFNALQSRAGQAIFLRLPQVQTALSENAFRDDVLQGLVETAFEPSDSESRCVDTFQEQMHKIFSDGWLTPRVVQKMIEKCTKNQAFQVVSSVLRLAFTSKIKVDQQSSTALFKAVSGSKWFEDILLLLKILHPLKLDHSFNQERMEIVFQEAWKQQLANTCRVIWHYAASHGYIRYSMLADVARELTQNVHPSKQSQSRPYAQMAALIVGVKQSMVSDTTKRFRRKGNSVYDTILRLKEWTPTGEQRHNQMQLAHGLLEQDLTTWQRCVPMEYEMLLNLLEEALALDLKWLENSTLSTTPVLELLQKAIPIKIEVSDRSGMTSDNREHEPDLDNAVGTAGSLRQMLEASKPRRDRSSSNLEGLEHSDYEEELKKAQSMRFQASA